LAINDLSNTLTSKEVEKITLIKNCFCRASRCFKITIVKADTEDSENIPCPTGFKYKCVEKDGWVLYKGDGDTVSY